MVVGHDPHGLRGLARPIRRRDFLRIRNAAGERGLPQNEGPEESNETDDRDRNPMRKSTEGYKGSRPRAGAAQASCLGARRRNRRGRLPFKIREAFGMVDAEKNLFASRQETAHE